MYKKWKNFLTERPDVISVLIGGYFSLFLSINLAFGFRARAGESYELLAFMCFVLFIACTIGTDLVREMLRTDQSYRLVTSFIFLFNAASSFWLALESDSIYENFQYLPLFAVITLAGLFWPIYTAKRYIRKKH